VNTKNLGALMFKIILFCFIALMSVACMEDKQENDLIVVEQPSTASNVADENLPDELKEDEDCDDKAEKAKKELPPEINLQGGGDTGCSLDEINAGADPHK
jgi:hypothetical protein